MRWRVIKSLIRLNIVYSADSRTLDKIRKQQIENPDISIPVKIVRTQLILGIIFSAVFGILLKLTDIKNQPENFGIYAFFFTLVTFLQGFLVVFNVFYESKDIEGYRPVPVTMAEVILGKSITVVMGTLFYLLPLAVIFFVMPFMVAPNILIAVFFAILNIIIIPMAVLMFAFVLVNAIAATAVFQKHKKAVSTILTGMISLILGVSFLALNPNLFVYQFLKNNAKLFQPFIQIMRFEEDPISSGSLVYIVPWIAAIILSLIYIRKVVLTDLYDLISGNIISKNIMQNNDKAAEYAELATDGNMDIEEKEEYGKGMGRKAVSFKRLLFKYNLGLLVDTTILFQFLITPQIIRPLIIFGSIFQLLKDTDGEVIDVKFTLVAAVVGIFYAFSTSGTLHFIIISLDRENFNFIRSLPMDFCEYMMYKFWFAFFIQDIIPVIFLIGVSLWMKLPIYMILILIITFLLTSLNLCHRYFKSDYNYLDVNWQSVTQLASRGGGNAERILVFFAVTILGVICTAAAFYISMRISDEMIIISTVCLVIVLTLISFSYHRMQIRYWKMQD